MASTQLDKGPAPEDNSESTADSPHGFAGRVRSAVVWRWGSQVAAQIITWTSTIMVVRLLEPTDYGLFAMTQVVLTALAFLNGQSFATSLVQTDRIDDRRIGQIFGLLLLFNGGLALTQLMMAPLAAQYFGEPMVEHMLRIQAVIFLTVPFTALPQELLARKLEFRRQGQVNMAAAIMGAGVALTLAWYGWGVWALVYAPIAMFFTRAIGMSVAARLWIKPVFDPRGAWDLVTFGGTLTLCQLFWIIQSQSDIVVAGRILSTYDLGLYSEALFLTLIITGRFLPPINEVAIAAYSELRREGRSLGPYFLKTARMVMMVTLPIYVGLSLTAEPAIHTLFGEKWAGMIPIVSGLALAMPVMALHFICSPTTNALGKPHIYLSTSIAGAIVMPCAFVWGSSQGAMGLVHAWWIAAPALLTFTLTRTLPRIGVSPLALFKELLPIIVAASAMAGAVVLAQAFVSTGIHIIDLGIYAAIGALVYAATLWSVWPDLVRETWALLRQREPATTTPEPVEAPPA